MAANQRIFQLTAIFDAVTLNANVFTQEGHTFSSATTLQSGLIPANGAFGIEDTGLQINGAYGLVRVTPNTGTVTVGVGPAGGGLRSSGTATPSAPSDILKIFQGDVLSIDSAGASRTVNIEVLNLDAQMTAELLTQELLVQEQNLRDNPIVTMTSAAAGVVVPSVARGKVVVQLTLAGAQAVTLPARGTYGDNVDIIVEKIAAVNGTIDGTGADTINGLAAAHAIVANTATHVTPMPGADFAAVFGTV